MKIHKTYVWLLAGSTLFWAGCSNESAPKPSETAEQSEPAENHAHPSEGPHHGSLIELGNEEYHAELVHDEEAGQVVIYILDGSAKELVPIAAESIVINTKYDGKPKQFALTAQPGETDPAGESSRFVSDDADLAQHLDKSHADHRLVLKIADRSYNGEIKHSHDH